MGREIKFRAWDIKHKEMVDVYDLSFYPSGILYLVNGRPLSDFELREYIGAKDAEGGEIFDKDIVESRWRPIGKTEDRVRRFVIVFNDGGYKQLEVGERTPAKVYAWSSVKVIGNIYEDRDLCGL